MIHSWRINDRSERYTEHGVQRTRERYDVELFVSGADLAVVRRAMARRPSQPRSFQDIWLQQTPDHLFSLVADDHLDRTKGFAFLIGRVTRCDPPESSATRASAAHVEISTLHSRAELEAAFASLPLARPQEKNSPTRDEQWARLLKSAIKMHWVYLHKFPGEPRLIKVTGPTPFDDLRVLLDRAEELGLLSLEGVYLTLTIHEP